MEMGSTNDARLGPLTREPTDADYARPVNDPSVALTLQDYLPRVLPAHWRLVERTPLHAFYRWGTMTTLVTLDREADGKRWLHVSCARPHRLPTWEELAEVKALFVSADRTALSILPPRTKHVNIHAYCLHLWCCLDGDVTPDFTRGLGTL